ncbi:MAG: alpha/beta hydrolase [Cyanobacteria bacterium K_DeepCast_35m_m2_023]|nr:alpha/beta hydrolase [Cyanobacteria bacterium K_DeepCast_35m_m2_023]
MSERLQIIAMHGWCGDQHSWDPWLNSWDTKGWRWRRGERGYGQAQPDLPQWDSAGGCRLVIAHSLGPHLLEPAVLAAADAVVLLTSFGRFVPAGRSGRSTQMALDGMARELAGADPTPMLRSFLARVAAPEPATMLQRTPVDAGLGPAGLQRLRDDLSLIAGSSDLLAAFPLQAKVLLVQAGADQIVAPEARQDLATRLPQADVVTLARAGHALIGTPTVGLVNAWIESLLPA